jgi:4-amino-4-deoxy-L-arabinose transferase-like glycosyltransferase
MPYPSDARRNSGQRDSRIWAAVALAVVLIGAIRIASTWRLFAETYDEATQIARGVEWLSAHVGLGPYLDGAHYHGKPTRVEESHAIFADAPDYYRLLAEARAGNLIFYVLACLGVWLLARECGGAAVAAMAVASFTLIPVVLGHAGMATTDFALVACLPLAFWSWQVGLESPDRKHAALAGAATALAILSKFSSFGFLPAMLAALLALRWRRRNLPACTRKAMVNFAVVFAVTMFLVCWAAYRFEVTPIRTPPGRQFLLLDRYIGTSGWLHALVYRLLEVPFPLSKILNGIGEVFQHSVDGHDAYLFGQVSRHGWWYFFPVVLLVKTPLAFMALAGLGAVMAIHDSNARASECLAAGTAMVLVSLSSSIDIGVRHVLPVYAFAAVLAGLAVVRLWPRTKLVGALCVCLIAANLWAHPHYLADFNLLAMGTPERIVTDSDLDWGQDLPFATRALIERGVREAWLAYAGVYDVGRERGVTYHALPPNTPVEGWVAISIRQIYFEGAMARAKGQPEPYGWLKTIRPTMRAGRSILIFDLRNKRMEREQP